MASSFSSVPSVPTPQVSTARRARTRTAEGAELDVLLDRWVKRLEEEPPSQPQEPSAARPEPPGNEASGPSALQGVTIRSGSATFEDAPGERIALDLRTGAIAHLGTVGVRGPLVNFRSLASGAGLDEAQAAALEHVAAWFGAPFDAVSAGEAGEPRLRWGCFRLGGESLARCLAAFAARDAAAFQAQLGRYEIGLTSPGEANAPEITAVDPASRTALRGREAELVIAAEPRLVAVLARAGRQAAAQIAQVETVVSTLLRSSLQLRLPSGTEVSTTLRSKRALAVLFYIDFVLGLRTVAAFVQSAPEDPATEEDVWIERFAARLERSHRGEHAFAMRRIASSPELG